MEFFNTTMSPPQEKLSIAEKHDAISLHKDVPESTRYFDDILLNETDTKSLFSKNSEENEDSENLKNEVSEESDNK